MDYFGRSLTDLKQKTYYKNAVAMCILQISELTGHLSEDFKVKYKQMSWQDIKRMRIVAAHRYGDLDSEILWDTIAADIPALKSYCIKIIKCFDV